LSADVGYCVLAEPKAAGAVRMLNAKLEQAGLHDRFVTLVLAILDYQNHTLSVVNAGHLAPLLRRANGTIEEIAAGDQTGLPLVVLSGYEYVSVDASLNPGDVLVLCTDGIYDALNTEGKLFGKERVLKVLKSNHGATQIGRDIVKAVEQFAAGVPQYDDITLVTVGRSK
jgi:serine phosphatase RsbU (regulator of sigma subunit)